MVNKDKFLKGSLTSRVAALLEERGEMSRAEVQAALGHLVTAARAVPLGRKRVTAEIRQGVRTTPPEHLSSTHLARLGKVLVFINVLRGLTRRGRVRRVRPGVYGPLAVPGVRTLSLPEDAGEGSPGGAKRYPRLYKGA